MRNLALCAAGPGMVIFRYSGAVINVVKIGMENLSQKKRSILNRSYGQRRLSLIPVLDAVSLMLRHIITCRNPSPARTGLTRTHGRWKTCAKNVTDSGILWLRRD